MNGSIRVSAKTVDDAITEAMIQLGVTSDRLEYEVIEKGSSGFLGIGMKQAVIEARRKPESEPEVVEKEPFAPVEEIREEKAEEIAEPVKAEVKKRASSLEPLASCKKSLKAFLFLLTSNCYPKINLSFYP